MKYTNDMVDTYIQGDIDTAMRIITDLAEVWIGLIHWKNISRQKIEVGEE